MYIMQTDQLETQEITAKKIKKRKGVRVTLKGVTVSAHNELTNRHKSHN